MSIATSSYSYDPIQVTCKSSQDDLHPILMTLFKDYGVNAYGFSKVNNTYWAKKEKNRICTLYFTLAIHDNGENNTLTIDLITNTKKEFQIIYTRLIDYIYSYEVIPSLYLKQ